MASSAPATVSPAAPLKVGFIGLSNKGWAATMLAPTLVQPALRSKYALTAISTTSPNSSVEAAAKWSAEAEREVRGYHGNPTNIVEGEASHGDLDLVAVSVKAPKHRETVLPVIRARQNFFIEWPVGATPEETREIADETRKYGVRSFIGLQGRQGVVANKVKALIGSGAIGKVLSASVLAHFPREAQVYTPEQKLNSSYLLERETGGTITTIPVGHQLDTLTYILGNFTEVTAHATTHYPTATIIDDTTLQPTGETRPYEGVDHIAINGLLTTGTLVNILWRAGTKLSTPGRVGFRCIIDGESGTIRLEDDLFAAGMLSISEPDLYVNGEKVELAKPKPGNELNEGALGMLTRNWEEYAKGEEEGTYATVEDAVRLKNVIEAIEESVKTGRRVSLQA